MTKNNQTLKQLLISRINQTDDEALLQQCIDLLYPKEERSKESESEEENEGDEIIETVTIASQIRQQHSDKQQLVSQAMTRHTPSATPLEGKEPEEEEWADDEEEGSLLSRLKANLWVVPTLVIVIAGIWGLSHLKACWSDSGQKAVNTTASRFETFTVGNITFKMVYVEGGTFMMGAGEKEKEEADSDEFPPHQVTLSDYMIGETEVTEGLWKAVMGDAPLPYDGDDHPAKKVSWDDCQLFVSRLSQMTGRPFTLPTEAQWEFAARGGRYTHDFKYAGSDNLDQVGWYSVNAWDKGKGNPDFGSHPVGSKAPNELGLYDMSGNVWEWCQDSYGRYTDEDQTDPQGQPGDMHSYRVNRGGSWDYIATSARSANRRNRTPDFRNFNLGLRLALPVTAQPK